MRRSLQCNDYFKKSTVAQTAVSNENVCGLFKVQAYALCTGSCFSIIMRKYI